MDQEERDRLDDIERREKGVYGKISDEVGKLYKHVKDLEDKLELRDREIEEKTNDRFTKHEVDIGKVKTDLDNHTGNQAIHKRPVSMETLQNMQRPDFSGIPPLGAHRGPVPAPYQPQIQETAISQASDEFSKMGVPWYLNPKWLLAVGTAIAGIIGAIAFAISSGRSVEKHPDKPDKPIPAAIFIEEPAAGPGD